MTKVLTTHVSILGMTLHFVGNRSDVIYAVIKALKDIGGDFKVMAKRKSSEPYSEMSMWMTAEALKSVIIMDEHELALDEPSSGEPLIPIIGGDDEEGIEVQV